MSEDQSDFIDRSLPYRQLRKYMTIRSVQRYLKTLVQMGLIVVIGGANDEYRYLLAPKAKQLFSVKGEGK